MSELAVAKPIERWAVENPGIVHQRIDGAQAIAQRPNPTEIAQVVVDALDAAWQRTVAEFLVQSHDSAAACDELERRRLANASRSTSDEDPPRRCQDHPRGQH